MLFDVGGIWQNLDSNLDRIWTVKGGKTTMQSDNAMHGVIKESSTANAMYGVSDCLLFLFQGAQKLP